MKESPLVFLVEHSTDYLFQLDQAFRKAGLNGALRVTRYGNEAVLYLKGVGVYADRQSYPLPELILIDLGLPDGSAMTVLGWIRRQSEFQKVPIVILAQESDDAAVQEALDHGANAYFVLREDVEGLVQMIQRLRPSITPPLARVPSGTN